MESLANTTTVDLEIVNENWVTVNLEIINEDKFHGWHLESSTNTIHYWLKNHQWKLSHCQPINHQRKQIPRMTHGIISEHNHCGLENCQWKSICCQPRNHQWKQISLLMFGIINKHNPLLTHKSSAKIESLLT